MTPTVAVSFAGPARVATGSGSGRAAQRYRVEVVDQTLVLRLAATGSPALRTPLRRVRATPLGRAGAVVVEVDGAPLLVDFTERRRGDGPLSVVRRAAHALRARRVRRRFLAVAREPQ